MILSRNKRTAIAVRQAKAKARLNIARNASRDGLSKAAAACRAQLSEAGLNTLLYREVGSTEWPISGSEPEQTL